MTYTLTELQKMMDEGGGSLNLGGCTGLTSLPDNLTVSGWLDLDGCTGLTSLPGNLTVGGWLNLGDTHITNPRHYRQLSDGEYVPGRYLYADGILTHVKRAKKIGSYTYYIGKIKGKNVISDGVYYAHCRTIAEGIDDLAFKSLADRGAEQYRGVGLDDKIPRNEAVAMYRIITGACKAGTQAFIDGLSEVKDEYTPREIIAMTDGQYGGGAFRKFFEE